MIKLYGIPNCDTVKKAQNFLSANNIAFTFLNFKVDGVNKTQLQTWIQELGLEKVVNKKSTTWKNLTAEEQADCSVAKTAIPIIMANSSLIKRPVLEVNENLLIGFVASDWQAALKMA